MAWDKTDVKATNSLTDFPDSESLLQDVGRRSGGVSAELATPECWLDHQLFHTRTAGLNTAGRQQILPHLLSGHHRKKQLPILASDRYLVSTGAWESGVQIGKHPLDLQVTYQIGIQSLLTLYG